MRDYIISASNIIYRSNGYPILNGIDWTFSKGEHWAILGENGAGKTTLLNIITGYTRPSSGKLFVLGEKIGRTDLRVLRRKIGWASSSLQEKLYAGEKAKEIVESGFYASIGLYDVPSVDETSAAEKIISDFNCMHLAERPYNTLSQGEKQKILIARAMVFRPDLLILDEPCAGLDLPSREKMIDLLDSIASGDKLPSLIVVTHHIEEIPRNITHVMLIKRGTVFASGEKIKIIKDNIVSDYFGIKLNITESDGRYFISGIG